VERLTGVIKNELGETICYFMNSSKSLRKSDTVKLILRSLPDMTDDECLEMAPILGGLSHLLPENQIFQVRKFFSEFLSRQER
jgi:hypothetical protein